MFENHSQAVFELLRDGRLIDREQLDAVQEEHRVTGKPIAAVALDLGLIEPEVLIERIAGALGCEHLREFPASLPADAVALIEGEQARGYGVIPLRADERSVDLLAVDPFNHRVVDDLAFTLGRDVRLVVGEPGRVAALIRQHYGEDEASLEEVLSEAGAAGPAAENPDALSAHEIEALASQTPIVRFVNLVLGRAVREQASDVHFEPFEREFKIRYRIDGTLHEMTPPPRALALPITSRLKVLANLDIAERRLPQDGRIKITLGGRPVDLRVSTLPTQFGESVVLRVLDQSAVQLDLSQLGLPDDVLAEVSESVRRPNGIVVVTGPTGSGKTTTLYSALRRLNTGEVKILTAEDPVEYELEGIMQVPMNPAAGLTFASALRAFLRQDPDVIMVGEIRDLETAQVAIQAALTGHLVLTTLHTNDAPGAVTRLIDMGVEPFLIASTVEAVLAQRLLRRVCDACRIEDEPPAELLAQVGLDAAALGGRRIYRGRGCARCGQTGYRGRLGIFEWLRMTDAVRERVTADARTLSLREAGVAQGMRSLRSEALRALLAGETTIEEVVSYT